MSPVETTWPILMPRAWVLLRRLPRVMPRILAALDWLPSVCLEHAGQQVALHQLERFGIEVFGEPPEDASTKARRSLAEPSASPPP